MPDMTMNRRDFLKVSTGASGSLILAVSIPGCATVQTGFQPETGEWKPDIWLELTRDDDILFTLARVEMGQGTYTGLTTLVAEELDVEPGRIKVKFAPVAPEYRNPLFGLQLTGASTSLATSWEPLRVAGAQARQMLVMAAARVWEVDAEQCKTQDGRVVHPNGLDSLRYGQLVELADREVIRGEVPLKPRSEWKYIGRMGSRLDARAKATCTAVYGMDVELPGMVYAVMTRSPRYGGKARSFNRDDVIGMPGVTDAFITERGVALVAQRYWQARKAQQQLQVEWDFSEALDTSTEAVFEGYRQAASKDPGAKERSDGNVDRAAARAKQVVEAEYEQPYLAHATMEPMNATAWYHDGGMDVWAPTQAPDLGRIAAARHTDLSPGKVNIHTTFLGGGFGRRLTQDYIEEAAAVAYQLKVPVKLIWSREEDTRHGFLRPAMLHRMKGSLNDGELTGWHHQIVGPTPHRHSIPGRPSSCTTHWGG
jgi:isoquinoline 1-oxidoreductase/isoquinoline 1-oxidoreductase beta subunit